MYDCFRYNAIRWFFVRIEQHLAQFSTRFDQKPELNGYWKDLHEAGKDSDFSLVWKILVFDEKFFDVASSTICDFSIGIK